MNSSNYLCLRAWSLAALMVAQSALSVSLAGTAAGGSVKGLQVVGDYLFVAAWGRGLQILDIHEPRHPKWVGGFDTEGCAMGVFVAGNHAYVADRLAGLQVLNVADPTRPIRVGRGDTGGEAWAVQVEGGYAYVANGTSGLAVVDVTNPAHPALVASCRTPERADAIHVVGNRAYLVNGGRRLTVVDVTAPTRPTVLGSKELVGCLPTSVAVEGERALVGRQILDVADPKSPKTLDSLDTETNNLPILFRTGSNSYSFIPAIPALTNGAFRQAIERQHAATVVKGVAETVQAIRSYPALYQKYQRGIYPTAGAIRNVHLSGGLVFAASYTAGLEIFDPRDGYQPVRLAAYKINGCACDVRAAGRYVYLLDCGANLYVFDVGDLARPMEAGRLGSRAYSSPVLAIRPTRSTTATTGNSDLPANVIAPQTPILLDPERQAGGVFAFTLRGDPGATYIVQASEDFSTWSAIATNTLPATGALRITDAAAANLSQRFYRTVLLP